MALIVSTPAAAQIVPAKEILVRSIAIPTVEGRGKVPELAAYYADVLKRAGYQDGDIAFVPMGETGYLTVTLKGKSSDKPIMLLGHMDVVEARAADWERDPFVPVEEKGFLFGRGAEDMKYDVAMMIATMARLKQEGFKPKQDIVLLITGDEETQMVTTAAAAQKYKHAGLVLNGDGGGTKLGTDGKPLFFRLQGGEKSYADYLITMTDPGGHSSTPTATNPIYRMARALERLDAYKFSAMQNDLTRASLAYRARSETGPMKAAIATFLANPGDIAATDLISTRPDLIGQIRTTCIATMIEGGHALNALPQKATANINCRIFPGVSFADVQAQLGKVLAEPAMTLSIVGEPVASDASPLTPDVVKAVTAAVTKRFPGLAIIPDMEAGASDSLYFRALGVPSYGVGSLAIRTEDQFLHGLNERVPVDGIDASLAYWHDLLMGIAK